MNDKKIMSLKFTRVKLFAGIAWLNFITLVLLFCIILLPRALPFPSTFLTFDEMTIGRWISQMTQAALEGDWQNTANNYPAVTLMWVEAAQIKIAQWLSGQPSVAPQTLMDKDEVIFASLPRRRLALAVVNTIIIFITFWPLQRIYHNFIAVTATILMALDPFLLTQSRVFRTEGLTTGLMILSALVIMVYAKQRQNRWLILSGLLGGLATLTKITSLYLLPFAGLTLLTWSLFMDKPDIWTTLKSTARDIFVWSLVLVVTFFVLWPVLWVAPLTVFSEMYGIMVLSAQEASATWGAEGEFFFWGEIWRDDPGILFYIVSLAYRTTPIIWLGLIATLSGLIAIWVCRWGNTKLPEFLEGLASLIGPTLLVSAYVFFYFIAMSLGASKVDRYLLPVFPGLSILAAVGFLPIAALLGKISGLNPLKNWVIWGVLLIGSAWLSLPHHPYYFSYWNPLLGGGQGAAKILPIGSGEGLDIMMAHLNSLSDAENTNLSGDIDVYYICRLIFVGNCLEQSEFLNSDYFIAYIFAQQRKTVKPSIIQTVKSEGELARQFTKDKVDYAELYQMPANLQPTEQWLGDHGRLRGYRLSNLEVGAGDPLKVTIFWENGEQHGWQLHDSEFFVKLLDETGQIYQSASAQLKKEFEPYLLHPKEMLLFVAPLQLPVDIPIGRYQVEIGLRLKGTQKETWNFSLPESANIITVNRGTLMTSAETLSIEHRLNQPIGKTGLILLGYDDLTRQEFPRFDLYWQADKRLAEDYVLNLTLLNQQGQTVVTWENLLSPHIHPLITWRPGEIVKTSFPLTLGYALPADLYQPVLSLLPVGERTTQPIETLDLASLPKNFIFRSLEVKTQHRLTRATFAQSLDLLGYDLEGKPDASQGGGDLFVTLYWLNRRPLTPIEVEVQVLSEKREVVAQQLRPIPTPIDPTEQQSASRYEFSLTGLPSFLTIKARPIGAERWSQVQMSDGVVVEQIVIDDILNKIAPILN